jgi:hypothetical protein
VPRPALRLYAEPQDPLMSRIVWFIRHVDFNSASSTPSSAPTAQASRGGTGLKPGAGRAAAHGAPAEPHGQGVDDLARRIAS